ncbi:hypothetical protein E1B28_001903 [Marasmius oreades]|uniref:Uncharacterized protein n=1 Tax=Marasmius oreades TaxID=181124 RepID=A0A9P8AG25_9AGAR|nr:uncharacterized protein E1B28_001903 [Marasmius oreades]KAG7100123.1 hypothetical protein E1B28_001903 [Marasmius oreades]
MANVADFDLLKNTHVDIGDLLWTKPEYRDAMRLHFGLLRAHEEKTHCNVEIKRLVTFMIDDHADYQVAIRRSELTDPDLAAELRRQSQYRSQLHGQIAEHLALTSKLEGFTGTLLPGKQNGRDSAITLSVPLPSWSTEVLGIWRASDGTYRSMFIRPNETERSQLAQQEFAHRNVNEGGILKLMEWLDLN